MQTTGSKKDVSPREIFYNLIDWCIGGVLEWCFGAEIIRETHPHLQHTKFTKFT